MVRTAGVLQPPARAIVSLNPSSAVALLPPAFRERLQDGSREVGGFTGGKDVGQGPVKVVWWRIAKHRHVIAAVELEAVDAEVNVGRGEECVLGGEIGFAGRSLAGEAGNPVVGDGLRFRLLWLVGSWWPSAVFG